MRFFIILELKCSVSASVSRIVCLFVQFYCPTDMLGHVLVPVLTYGLVSWKCVNSFSNGGALFFYQLIEDFSYRFRMRLFRRNKLKNPLWSGKGSANAVFLSKCRFIVNGRGWLWCQWVESLERDWFSNGYMTQCIIYSYELKIEVEWIM